MARYLATLTDGNRYILSMDSIIFDANKPREIDEDMKLYLEKTAISVIGHAVRNGVQYPTYACKFSFEEIAEPKPKAESKEKAQNEEEIAEKKAIAKTGKSLV